MKKGLVFGVIAIAAAAFTGTAMAGLPCANTSLVSGGVEVNSPCADADAKFSYGQAWDNYVITVTVNDCLGAPVDTCDVRLDYGATYEAAADLGLGANCRLSGTGTETVTTDANGHAQFSIKAGGGGQLNLSYTVTATCAAPEIVLAAVADTLCFKSTDFNGDSFVNFFDNFKYLPQLLTTVGWSGDLNCTDPVNFFDNFAYLPDLLSAVSMPTNVSVLDGGGVAACGP